MSKLTSAAIIPFYNTQIDHFRDLLKSLNLQIRPFDEIIIVNDGSTETSALNLLDDSSFQALPTTILHEKNGGVAQALTIGAKCAKSDIIFEVDSDDILLPQYVKTYMAVFESKPSIDGVSSGYKLFFDGEDYSQEASFHRTYMPTGLHVPELFFQNCAGGQNSAFRKSALEKTGYWDKRFVSMQDWGMWLQFHLAGLRQYVIKEYHYLYRVHASGVAQDKKKQLLHEQNLADLLSHAQLGHEGGLTLAEYRTKKRTFLDKHSKDITPQLKKLSLNRLSQLYKEFTLIRRREGLYAALKRSKNFFLYGRGFE